MVESARPKIRLLREDLQWVDLGSAGAVLRDQMAGTRFKLGAEARGLIRLLEEGKSLREVRRRYGETYGSTLSLRYIREFVQQLAECGLLASNTMPRTSRRPVTGQPGGASAPPSPSDEVPAARLNHCLDLLLVPFGWLLHPATLVLVLGLAVVVGFGFVGQAGRFLSEFAEFSRQSTLRFIFLVLLCRFLFLNAPRELALGMAARRFGGRAYGLGFRIVHGFLPTIQINIEDSIAPLEGRPLWTLLTVRFWSTLTVAALAVAAWLVADADSLLNRLSLLLVVLSLIGAVLHFNIFMRLDGYLVMAHLLKVPRLLERATAHTAAWLCLRWAPEPLTDGERFWFKVYGVGIYLWRLFISVVIVGGLGWILVTRTGRLGVALGAVALAFWLGNTIRRTVMGSKSIHWAARTRDRWWIRWPIRVAILGGLVACGLIPYTHEVSGECRLVPNAEVGVRSEIAGRVRQVHVAEGGRIEKGDLIITLEAREERGNVEMSRAQLAKARAELALLEAGARPEEIAMASEQLKLRQIELELFQTEFERLEVLSKSGSANEVELSRAKEERDTATQMVRISKEYLQSVEKGAREEELRIAQAEVLRLEAQLAHNEEMYSLREIRAPIGGRVATPNIEQRLGQYVMPGDLLTVLHDTSRLWVQMVVPDAGALSVRPGASAKVRLWACDRQLLAGSVQSVSSFAAELTELNVERIRSDREIQLEDAVKQDRARYVRAYIGLDQMGGGLLPGMSGHARVVVGEGHLWQALVRPVARFARVEVWSWLP